MAIVTVLERIVRDGFVLVFNQDRLDVVETAKALQAAGVGNMEVTCRIERPLEKVARLRRELPGFAVGAASLVDVPAVVARHNAARGEDPLPSVAQAVEAGAEFLVSAANFRAQTYEQYGGRVAMIPGCGTATEVLEQYGLGANLCKLFPAKQLGGAGFVKAFDAASHKLIPLVPTGGTKKEDIAGYVAAGVFVLGGSFSMIAKETMERIVTDQDYDLLAYELRAIKEEIDACRARQWPGVDWAKASLAEVVAATGRDFNLPERK